MCVLPRPQCRVDGDDRLEEAGVQPLDVGSELRRPFREGILTDRDPVYGDSLTGGNEVRRGVQSDAPPLRPQLVGYERTRGPLPVRAADVDCGKVALWVAEHVE